MNARGIISALTSVSVSVSWLILAVLLARVLTRNAPKWTRFALWALVAVRLCVPVSITSALSIVPEKFSGETVAENTDIGYTGYVYHYELGAPGENGEMEIVAAAGDSSLPNGGITNAEARENAKYIQEHPEYHVMRAGIRESDYRGFLVLIWLIGTAAMLGYAVVSEVRLRRSLRSAAPIGGGAYISDEVTSPFVLGVVKPRIYLPSDLGEQEREYVIAHERAHIARRDNIIKPFGFAILAVYWFHPLVWLSYVLFCRDIELACDERVIRNADLAYKKAYSEALLRCSVPHGAIAVYPLSFGEIGVKARIKAVLNYKKPAFWVAIVAMVACIAVAVGFMTSPKKATTPYEWTSTVETGDIAVAYRSSGFGRAGTGFELSEEQKHELCEILHEVSKSDFREGTLINSDQLLHITTYAMDTEYGFRIGDRIVQCFFDSETAHKYSDKVWNINNNRLYEFLMELTEDADSSAPQVTEQEQTVRVGEVEYGTVTIINNIDISAQPPTVLESVELKLTDESTKSLWELIQNHSRTRCFNSYEHPVRLYDRIYKFTIFDGSFFELHHWYANGFSFHPAHAGEYDFYNILTYYDKDGKIKSVWRMGYDFDEEFGLWNADYISETEQTEPVGDDPGAPKENAAYLVKWADFEEDYFAEYELKLPEFENVSFHCTSSELTAVSDAEAKTILSGTPVWNVYLTDLTGDGKTDFCATVASGSGPAGRHVVMYDFAEGEEYTLQERPKYDYSLYDENGVLMVLESSNTAMETGGGRLVFNEKGYGQEKLAAVITVSMPEKAEIGTYAVTSGESSITPTILTGDATLDKVLSAQTETLVIASSEKMFKPFTVYNGEGNEIYGWYRLFDAQTGEELDVIHPSGLEPQTYILKDADYGRDYIVTLNVADGSTLVFGVYTSAIDALSQPNSISEEELNAIYALFRRNSDGTGRFVQMLMSSNYAAPKDIHIGWLFREGPKDEGGEREISDAELDALRAAVSDETWDFYMEADLYKTTRADMDRLLVKYLGLTLDETNERGMDFFTYLPEYDAYYSAAYDTQMIIPVFTYAVRCADGLVELGYDALWGGYEGSVLVLRPTEDGYLFYSNYNPSRIG